MLTLFPIPELTEQNKKLWEKIHQRNIWFIRLRYYAVIFFTFFILFGKTNSHVELQTAGFHQTVTSQKRLEKTASPRP